jgi:hypothetical protein
MVVMIASMQRCVSEGKKHSNIEGTKEDEKTIVTKKNRRKKGNF